MFMLATSCMSALLTCFHLEAFARSCSSFIAFFTSGFPIVWTQPPNALDVCHDCDEANDAIIVAFVLSSSSSSSGGLLGSGLLDFTAQSCMSSANISFLVSVYLIGIHTTPTHPCSAPITTTKYISMLSNIEKAIGWE